MIRGKRPEANLKLGYRKLLWTSLGVSILFHGLLFVVFPHFDFKAYSKPPEQIIIQLEQIPETEQERRPPPPPRPVVPLASDDLDIPEDATIETTDLDLDLEGLLPPPPLDAAPALELEEEDEVVPLWMAQVEPRVIRQVMPKFPEIARKANIEGKVFVQVLLGKDGKVKKVLGMSGPEVFHEAAGKAVMQWVLTPAMQNDRPVLVHMTIPISFQLH